LGQSPWIYAPLHRVFVQLVQNQVPLHDVDQIIRTIASNRPLADDVDALLIEVREQIRETLVESTPDRNPIAAQHASTARQSHRQSPGVQDVTRTGAVGTEGRHGSDSGSATFETIVAANVTDALREVRRLFGPDALLIAVRTIPEGVEVIAGTADSASP
jgi:hypothetical protein